MARPHYRSVGWALLGWGAVSLMIGTLFALVGVELGFIDAQQMMVIAAVMMACGAGSLFKAREPKLA